MLWTASKIAQILGIWPSITPPLPWSRCIDLPNLTVTKEVAPGRALHFPRAPFPIISSGQTIITFHLTHFLDRRSFWRITSQFVAISAIAVCQNFSQVQPRQKNNISLNPIVPPFFSYARRISESNRTSTGYFNLESIRA